MSSAAGSSSPGFFCANQQDLLVASHGGLEGLDGLFPSDEQWDDHVGIDHYVT